MIQCVISTMWAEKQLLSLGWWLHPPSHDRAAAIRCVQRISPLYPDVSRKDCSDVSLCLWPRSSQSLILASSGEHLEFFRPPGGEMSQNHFIDYIWDLPCVCSRARTSGKLQTLTLINYPAKFFKPSNCSLNLGHSFGTHLSHLG